jgi:hypothetical protein
LIKKTLVQKEWQADELQKTHPCSTFTLAKKKKSRLPKKALEEMGTLLATTLRNNIPDFSRHDEHKRMNL